MSGVRFGADFLSTYEEGIKREWILGNGLGGHASSTIIGTSTRTYHGLLIAAPENTPGRFLLLSSLDEEISFNEEIYKLAAHKILTQFVLKATIILQSLLIPRFPFGPISPEILP